MVKEYSKKRQISEYVDSVFTLRWSYYTKILDVLPSIKVAYFNNYFACSIAWIFFTVTFIWEEVEHRDFEDWEDFYYGDDK